MDAVVAHLTANQDLYVQRLSEWVAIKSVSASAPLRPEVIRMVKHVETELQKLGCTTQLKDLGNQDLGEAGIVPLPPVLLAQLGNDPKKKTVCVYGHLDVQPALKSDGWDTEPFELTMKGESMFARGSSDDKGPVLGWINVIEAFQACKVEVPINMKFVFEGMEESGSVGLKDLINREKDNFLKDTDFVCISDNYWLGKNKPCVTYGLRGMAYFAVSVECASKDLHSGVYGGSVHEAMTDLVQLLASLVDSKGVIKVAGLAEMVAPVTEEEKLIYEKLDFDPEDLRSEINAPRLLHDSKEAILMQRWRFPSLSIHGIEGAFYDPGAKTVIPRKVIGKFSIRLVPHMDPAQVEKCVRNHLEQQFSALGSPNKLHVSNLHSATSWVADCNHPHYQAGIKACKKVFGVDPDLTREGGSIPTTLFFQDALNKNVMLLPMGACDDSAHSQNEKLDKRNYFKGMELFAEYINQVSLL